MRYDVYYDYEYMRMICGGLGFWAGAGQSVRNVALLRFGGIYLHSTRDAQTFRSDVSPGVSRKPLILLYCYFKARARDRVGDLCTSSGL